MPHSAVGVQEPPGATCFIARQPIFDSPRALYGYELLFRSAGADRFNGTDGEAASLHVIGNALSAFGLEALTGGKRAFINFPRSLLVDGHAHLLPPDRVVVEILETVEPDQEVIQACRDLRAAGYVVALDDFVGDPKFEALVEVADIIKVDFRGADPDQRRRFAETLVPRGIQLLAEKVETWDEYREAADAGYALFQGYFFCRPQTLSSKALRPSALAYVRLLEELNRPEVDLHRVEQLLERDATLALNLLSYLNSALFASSSRVTSLRHAALLLGPRNLKRWANMMAVLGLCEGKPPELFVTCVVRARFAEVLGCRAELKNEPFEMFLIGLLVAADALLERPLDEALRLFSVSADIRDALLEGRGRLGPLCALIRAYEAGAWDEVVAGAAVLGVAHQTVLASYQQALGWMNDAHAMQDVADE